MKVTYTKDWRKKVRDEKKSVKSKSKVLHLEVIRSEDLPELLTQHEAADILRVHYKTVEEYRRDGKLRFIKKGGRYFTTPAWIAEHLEAESKIA